MKKDFKHLDPYRIEHGLMGSPRDGSRRGAFIIQVADQRKETVLMVIATDGCDDNGIEIDDPSLAWEHVSVHTRYDAGTALKPDIKMRIPTWPEMQLVKTLFWDDDERVIQFHPPEEEYVNQHPFVLHLWKPCPSAMGKFDSMTWPNKMLVGIIPEDGEVEQPITEPPQEDVIPVVKKGDILQRKKPDIQV